MAEPHIFKRIGTTVKDYVDSSLAGVCARTIELQTIQDTLPNNANETTNGVLSIFDKTKLDSITEGANNYSHPTDDGSLHIPIIGTNNTGKILTSGGIPRSAYWNTTTKTDVGLNAVDNTTDSSKPVSLSVTSSLIKKQDNLISPSNIQSINSESLLGTGDIQLYYPGDAVKTTSTLPSSEWLLCDGANYTRTTYPNISSYLPDGVNPWVATARTIPSGSNWRALTYGAGVFVAIQNGGSSVASSPDGITWNTGTMPAYTNWISVTHGSGVFVAVASHASTAATSPDGITWTARTMPITAVWTSVTYGAGVFVAVAYNGTAATSQDGITWVVRTLSDVSGWFSVTYGNGIFVAVAENSTSAATSLDGIIWTTRTLPTSATWQKVSYGNGIFVAVAYGGSTVVTSPDGITWTARTLPNNLNLQSLAYGNGIFVAMAYGGIMSVTSTDGITWTSRISSLPYPYWVNLTYGAGIFVAITNTTATATISTTTPDSTKFAVPSLSTTPVKTYIRV